MFYDPRTQDHGLPHNPWLALVVPRPIGWISTVGPYGTNNLAPYSCFNAISGKPPFVVFSADGPKDSVTNAEATGAFCVNIATYDLREAMNQSSAPYPAEVDEFAAAGLTPVACENIPVMRVAESPVSIECRQSLLRWRGPRSTDFKTKDQGPRTHQTLSLEVSDFIATVTIDRAPVNAQNNRFREELVEVIDALGDRTDVRAIIITGAGKAFSAGADLSERPTREPGVYTAHNRRVRASFDCLLECPKPIIAAVNGAAIGAGCVTALCSDIIVTSEKGFLQMTEVMVGLAGGVAHVRRHFGESDARMMVMTARRVYGPELLRMNVASACTAPEDLLDTARGIAADIAKASPSAVRAAKKSFQQTECVSIYEGYRFEQTQTKALSTSEDTAEAMAAFREKRAPVFKS